MSPAASPAGTHSLQAVCYKCQYRTYQPPTDPRCPQCSFPLILQPQDQRSSKANVREIFHRTSVGVGPKLPGLASKRMAAVQVPPVARPVPSVSNREQAMTADSLRSYRLGISLAFVSAIVLGVAAAVVQGGF